MILHVRLAVKGTVGPWARGILVASDDGMLLHNFERGLLEGSWGCRHGTKRLKAEETTRDQTA